MFPVLFKTESLVLYTYPVIFALAWATSLQYIWYQLQEGHKDFILFSMVSFISAWTGAKLLFLFTIPDTLLTIIDQYNFWTGGGFVFYGGLLVGLLVVIAWKQIRAKPFDMRLLIPAVCLGHAIGRIGCFLTGCCFGVQMHNGSHFPVTLVESLSLFALFVYFHRRRNQSFYQLLVSYLGAYAVIRFGLEFLRGDEVRGHFGRFSTSQWIALIVIVIYPLLNYFSLDLKRRK